MQGVPKKIELKLTSDVILDTLDYDNLFTCSFSSHITFTISKLFYM